MNGKSFAEAAENKRELYQEADKLLGLAERLQDKYESWEGWFYIVFMMIALVPLTLIAIAAHLTMEVFSGRSPQVVELVVIYGYAVLTGLFLVFWWVKVQRHLKRDRRIISGIVDMLREVESGIAEKDNLSSLERAELRIRLSRFDIGPGGGS